MEKINELRSQMTDPVKDIKLNLSSVLTQSQVLSTEDTWAVALCAAYFIQDKTLADAIESDAGEELSAEAREDAKAAAAIMAMNTVYYRFRHMVGKESYSKMPAGLRMNRMTRPATSTALFELCSMACAALEGCELCIQSHEAKLTAELSENHVHEAVRIGAVIKGASVALS